MKTWSFSYNPDGIIRSVFVMQDGTYRIYGDDLPNSIDTTFTFSKITPLVGLQGSFDYKIQSLGVITFDGNDSKCINLAAANSKSKTPPPAPLTTALPVVVQPSVIIKEVLVPFETGVGVRAAMIAIICILTAVLIALAGVITHKFKLLRKI